MKTFKTIREGALEDFKRKLQGKVSEKEQAVRLGINLVKDVERVSSIIDDVFLSDKNLDSDTIKKAKDIKELLDKSVKFHIKPLRQLEKSK